MPYTSGATTVMNERGSVHGVKWRRAERHDVDASPSLAVALKISFGRASCIFVNFGLLIIVFASRFVIYVL
jgi:hypothetical protein